jgi:hypothetical protein
MATLLSLFRSDKNAYRQTLAAEASRIGQNLNVNPQDILAIMSYETGGTLDPAKRGLNTKWGQHIGLIQAGRPQAKKYNLSPNATPDQYFDGVERYLRDHGVKGGEDLTRLYSAVNAGGTSDRHLRMTDKRAGGAPGNVMQKVQNQFKGHIARAATIMGNEGGGEPFNIRAQEKMFSPQTTPSAPAAAQPEALTGLRMRSPQGGSRGAPVASTGPDTTLTGQPFNIDAQEKMFEQQAAPAQQPEGASQGAQSGLPAMQKAGEIFKKLLMQVPSGPAQVDPSVPPPVADNSAAMEKWRLQRGGIPPAPPMPEARPVIAPGPQASAPMFQQQEMPPHQAPSPRQTAADIPFSEPPPSAMDPGDQMGLPQQPAMTTPLDPSDQMGPGVPMPQPRPETAAGITTEQAAAKVRETAQKAMQDLFPEVAMNLRLTPHSDTAGREREMARLNPQSPSGAAGAPKMAQGAPAPAPMGMGAQGGLSGMLSGLFSGGGRAPSGGSLGMGLGAQQTSMGGGGRPQMRGPSPFELLFVNPGAHTATRTREHAGAVEEWQAGRMSAGIGKMNELIGRGMDPRQAAMQVISDPNLLISPDHVATYKSIADMAQGIPSEQMIGGLAQTYAGLYPNLDPETLQGVAGAVLRGQMPAAEALKQLSEANRMQGLAQGGGPQIMGPSDVRQGGEASPEANNAPDGRPVAPMGGPIYDTDAMLDNAARLEAMGFNKEATQQRLIASEVHKRREMDPNYHGAKAAAEITGKTHAEMSQPLDNETLSLIGAHGVKRRPTMYEAKDAGLHLRLLADRGTTQKLLEYKSTSLTNLRQTEELAAQIDAEGPKVLGLVGSGVRFFDNFIQFFPGVKGVFDTIWGENDGIANTSINSVITDPRVRAFVESHLAGASRTVQTQFTRLAYQLATAEKEGRLSNQDFENWMQAMGNVQSAGQAVSALMTIHDGLMRSSKEFLAQQIGFAPLELHSDQELIEFRKDARESGNTWYLEAAEREALRRLRVREEQEKRRAQRR